MSYYRGVPYFRGSYKRVSTVVQLLGVMIPLYCGHLGDLVKCPVYSGTPLLWTPWGPGEVSCIEKCPHFRGNNILRKYIIWNIAKCLISEVSLFQECPLRGAHCKISFLYVH